LEGRTAADVREVWVTDYYTLRPLQARQAFFVVGGEVHGPMGRDFAAFATEASARGFAADHKGERVLRWQDVSAALVEALR